MPTDRKHINMDAVWIYNRMQPSDLITVCAVVVRAHSHYRHFPGQAIVSTTRIRSAAPRVICNSIAIRLNMHTEWRKHEFKNPRPVNILTSRRASKSHVFFTPCRQKQRPCVLSLSNLRRDYLVMFPRGHLRGWVLKWATIPHWRALERWRKAETQRKRRGRKVANPIQQLVTRRRFEVSVSDDFLSKLYHEMYANRPAVKSPTRS